MSSMMGEIGEAFDRWSTTPMWDTVPPVAEKAFTNPDSVKRIVEEATKSIGKASESIAKSVREFSAIAINKIQGAPQAIAEVAREPLKAISKSQAFSKSLIYAVTGATVLAGIAFIYRGFSQNYAARKPLKTPVSLVPTEKGVENESLSEPLGWIDRGRSIGQRVAFPILVGAVPIFIGAFTAWNVDALSAFVRGSLD